MSLMFAIAVGVIFWFLLFALYWLVTSSHHVVPEQLVEDEFDEAVERNR